MHIGLLHPGEMGAAVGALLVRTGYQVLWASAGRSRESAARADAAGLTDVEHLRALTGRVQLLLSICPPESAQALAEEVAASGYSGLFVDTNAISPQTARRVATIVKEAGATLIDGGLVGPPPMNAGSTRLYLSGDRASEVQALFRDTHLEAIKVADEVGAASALKMCYAAWTKGSAALILSIRALACAEGVEAPLVDEWHKSQPTLDARFNRALDATPDKAWRFAGEMREIADSFDAAGLARGFHDGAREVFERLSTFKGNGSPDADTVLATLMEPATGTQSEIPRKTQNRVDSK